MFYEGIVCVYEWFFDCLDCFLADGSYGGFFKCCDFFLKRLEFCFELGLCAIDLSIGRLGSRVDSSWRVLFFIFGIYGYKVRFVEVPTLTRAGEVRIATVDASGFGVWRASGLALGFVVVLAPATKTAGAVLAFVFGVIFELAFEALLDWFWRRSAFYPLVKKWYSGDECCFVGFFRAGCDLDGVNWKTFLVSQWSRRLKVVFVEDLLKLFVVDVDVFVDAEEVESEGVYCFSFWFFVISCLPSRLSVERPWLR